MYDRYESARKERFEHELQIWERRELAKIKRELTEEREAEGDAVRDGRTGVGFGADFFWV